VFVGWPYRPLVEGEADLDVDDILAHGERVDGVAADVPVDGLREALLHAVDFSLDGHLETLVALLVEVHHTLGVCRQRLVEAHAALGALHTLRREAAGVGGEEETLSGGILHRDALDAGYAGRLDLQVEASHTALERNGNRRLRRGHLVELHAAREEVNGCLAVERHGLLEPRLLVERLALELVEVNLVARVGQDVERARVAVELERISRARCLKVVVDVRHAALFEDAGLEVGDFVLAGKALSGAFVVGHAEREHGARGGHARSLLLFGAGHQGQVRDEKCCGGCFCNRVHGLCSPFLN